MVCREVTHEDEDCRVALLDEVTVVGNHIHHAAVARSAWLWCNIFREGILLAVCNVVVFTRGDVECTDSEHNKEYRKQIFQSHRLNSLLLNPTLVFELVATILWIDIYVHTVNLAV